MTTYKNNFCYPGATAPGFKNAARASHGNAHEDNFENVANVEMLPVSMLPIANGN